MSDPSEGQFSGGGCLRIDVDFRSVFLTICGGLAGGRRDQCRSVKAGEN